jgi:YesN/AraC family two-component response regulator
VGYHDQFYFSRVFKSVTGMSPSEFAGRADLPAR